MAYRRMREVFPTAPSPTRQTFVFRNRGFAIPPALASHPVWGWGYMTVPATFSGLRNVSTAGSTLRRPDAFQTRGVLDLAAAGATTPDHEGGLGAERLR